MLTSSINKHTHTYPVEDDGADGWDT